MERGSKGVGKARFALQLHAHGSMSGYHFDNLHISTSKFIKSNQKTYFRIVRKKKKTIYNFNNETIFDPFVFRDSLTNSNHGQWTIPHPYSYTHFTNTQKLPQCLVLIFSSHNLPSFAILHLAGRYERPVTTFLSGNPTTYVQVVDVAVRCATGPRLCIVRMIRSYKHKKAFESFSQHVTDFLSYCMYEHYLLGISTEPIT